MNHLPCAVGLTNKYLYAIVTYIIKICYSKKLKSQHCNRLRSKLHTRILELILRSLQPTIDHIIKEVLNFLISINTISGTSIMIRKTILRPQLGI